MICGHYPYGKGFPIISVQTRLGYLDFSLYGGQVLNWGPLGGWSVIFLGEKAKFKKGQAIRGGIPICWPWFGKGADGKQVPSHGVARISEWTLEEFEEHEDGSATLCFSLDPEDKKLPRAIQLIEMGKDELKLMLQTIHREDGESMPLSGALHTYFMVSDYRNVAVTGLEEVPFREYAEDAVPHSEDPLIPLGHIDRTYGPVPEESVVCIHDPRWRRTLEIERIRANSCVVWHPGLEAAGKMEDLGRAAAKNMLALEVALLPEENFMLHAGATHCMGMKIRVVRV